MRQSEFSYSYYIDLLRYMQDEFRLVIGRNLKLETTHRHHKSTVFIRHDIDVSPERALRMAEVEHNTGVRSTYHFMVDSLMYQPEDPLSTLAIREIKRMGHEVGLHLDMGKRICNRRVSPKRLKHKLSNDALRLEKVIGNPIYSFSFHRQGEKPPGTHDCIIINGIVNTFATVVGSKENRRYIADSNGRYPNLCVLLQLTI